MKKLTKLKAEINEIETRRTLVKINETKTVFKQINKIDKSLTRLYVKRDKTQINKIKKTDITTDNIKNCKNYANCYEQLHTTK